MSFRTMTTRDPRPEHIEAVLAVLQDGALHTPADIIEKSGQSMTAVNSVLNQLERSGRLDILRQNEAPKVRVSLKANSPS